MKTIPHPRRRADCHRRSSSRLWPLQLHDEGEYSPDRADHGDGRADPCVIVAADHRLAANRRRRVRANLRRMVKERL